MVELITLSDFYWIKFLFVKSFDKPSLAIPLLGMLDPSQIPTLRNRVRVIRIGNREQKEEWVTEQNFEYISFLFIATWGHQKTQRFDAILCLITRIIKFWFKPRAEKCNYELIEKLLLRESSMYGKKCIKKWNWISKAKRKNTHPHSNFIICVSFFASCNCGHWINNLKQNRNTKADYNLYFDKLKKFHFFLSIILTSISKKFAGTAYISSRVCFLTFNRDVADVVSSFILPQFVGNY